MNSPYDIALQQAQSGQLEKAWNTLALNTSSLGLRELHLMLDIALLAKEIAWQEQSLILLLQKQANNYRWVNQLSVIYYHAQHFHKAVKLLRQYTSIESQNASAWFNLGFMSKLAGEYKAAIEAYKKALLLKVDSPEEVYCNIGNIYSQELLDAQKATESYEKALECNKSYVQAKFNLAGLLEREGKLEEACAAFLDCAKSPSFCLKSLSRALELESNANSKLRIADKIQLLLKGGKRTENVIEDVDALFSLGRFYEEAKQYEKSWACFVEANNLDLKQRSPESIEKSLKQCDLIKREFNPDIQVSQNQSDLVFICGLYRSGSTLLETMLSTHPRLVSGGEIDVFRKRFFDEQDYFSAPIQLNDTKASEIISEYLSRLKMHANVNLDELDTQNKGPKQSNIRHLVLDKNPENFLLVGYIKKLFPKAKFIWTLREKQNSVFSMYAQHFGFYQAYSSKVSDISTFYEQHLGLLAFWQNYFNEDIKVVDYEQLVSSPEQTISEIYHFLQIEKDNNYRKFNESKHLVSTASMAQIRKPLHKKSLNRVEPFKKWLDI
ncbi:sulfotransferase [Glaciecola sp. MF2-115]|uniref:sulfotransferase n=1 Tax=Glaciecola sp. MF2-115 TaxID=3384827 RepID=UPI0039A3EDF8